MLASSCAAYLNEVDPIRQALLNSGVYGGILAIRHFSGVTELHVAHTTPTMVFAYQKNLKTKFVFSQKRANIASHVILLD